MPFSVGDKVLLSTKNFTLVTPGPVKLWPKFIGPFKVLRVVGKVAYKLELPRKFMIHPVFHVNLLKKFVEGRGELPPPILEDVGALYTIDKLLDVRTRKIGKGSRREYLVKWEDYGPEHNTWEPATVIEKSAPIVVKQFEKSQKALRGVEAVTKGVKRKPSQLASRDDEVPYRLHKRYTSRPS